jgi:predicted RNA-binding protein with PIN domain
VRKNPLRNIDDHGEGKPLYIIDGYNVIFNRKDFRKKRSLEASRNYFARMLDSYASRKKVEITVVWDGSGILSDSIKGTARVTTVYSASNQRADEKIVRMVQGLHNRRRVTVVSDDRKHIVGTVKNLGAHTMCVEEFLNLIGFHGEKQQSSVSSEQTDDKSPADDLSVEQWLKIFYSKSKK